MLGFWSITRNTFTQTIRQPVYGVIIVATFALLVLNVPLSGWTIGTQTTDYHASDQQMLESIGLSTLLVAGLLVAAFSASTAITREIEEKTALTVISKPIARATFVLGKFVGVALAVILAFYLCAVVYLITIRHGVKSAAWDEPDTPAVVLGVAAFALTIVAALLGNLYFGWSFVAAGVRSGVVLLTAALGAIAFIGPGWEVVPFGEGIRPPLFGGMAMMLLAVMIFAAVAVAASTRLTAVATLLVCVGVLIVGLMHPYLFSRLGEDIPVVRALGWVVPNLSYFDPQDAVSGDSHIPAGYLALTAAYTGIYVFAALAAAMAMFQRRQLEASSESASLPTLAGLLAWAGRALAIVAVLAGLVLLSIPRLYSAATFAGSAALIVGGALVWLLWGFFGRGVRWAHSVVTALAALLLVRSALCVFWSGAPAWLHWRAGAVRLTVVALLSAIVLVILFLPKTRRHFKSETVDGERA
ncbi:MAG: ABC transporter permease subunit [Phycisphaerae bacterium]